MCVCESFLLGYVVSVDDGGGAQQLLQFLGFEGLWEALQSYQQQLQLLRSPESRFQVSLQGSHEDLLKHLLRDLMDRMTYTRVRKPLKIVEKHNFCSSN